MCLLRRPSAPIESSRVRPQRSPSSLQGAGLSRGTSKVSDTCPKPLVPSLQNLPSQVRGPGSGRGCPHPPQPPLGGAPRPRPVISPCPRQAARAPGEGPETRSLCKPVPLERIDRKTVQLFTCRSLRTSLLMAIGHPTSELTLALKRGQWLVGGDKEGVGGGVSEAKPQPACRK